MYCYLLIVINTPQYNKPFRFKVQRMDDDGRVTMPTSLLRGASGTETKLLTQLFFECLPGRLDFFVVLWVVEEE